MKRTVYIKQEDWDKIKNYAKVERRSLSSFLVEAALSRGIANGMDRLSTPASPKSFPNKTIEEILTTAQKRLAKKRKEER